MTILSELQEPAKWVKVTETDLYFWIKVLNTLDEILEKWIKENTLIKEKVLIVLRFLINLIEKAHTKTLFNSVEWIVDIIQMYDEEVVLECLNVLIATIKQTHFKGKITKVHENIDALRISYFLSEGYNLGNPEWKSFNELN